MFRLLGNLFASSLPLSLNLPKFPKIFPRKFATLSVMKNLFKEKIPSYFGGPHTSENLHSNPKLFADDTSLFSTVYDITETTNELNNDLRKTNIWAY